VSLRLVLSHTGPAAANAALNWRLDPGAGLSNATAIDSASADLIPGPPYEVARVEFAAPEVNTPQQWMLTAAIDGVTANTWPLWFYPPVPAWPENLRIYDPAGGLAGYDDIPHTFRPETGMLLITSMFTADVVEFVQRGGRVIVVQHGAGSLPALASDFWGEAITLLYDHPLLARFPHEGHADMQFYHIAGDHVLTSIPGADSVQPVIGRLNARRFDLAYYLAAFRLGPGRGFATTLRLTGGQGDQAARLTTNTVGRWLLWLMVDQLSSSSP
jgi:hypothetical protein